MKIIEMQLKDQAIKAVNYFTAGGKKSGGNKLKHKLNPYGIALKYIFITRDLTYADVAKKFKTTPQNINHLVNRMKRSSFNEFFVDKLCYELSVDGAFFNDLVKEIDNVLEAK